VVEIVTVVIVTAAIAVETVMAADVVAIAADAGNQPFSRKRKFKF
jgi:hypothetical protein